MKYLKAGIDDLQPLTFVVRSTLLQKALHSSAAMESVAFVTPVQRVAPAAAPARSEAKTNSSALSLTASPIRELVKAITGN